MATKAENDDRGIYLKLPPYYELCCIIKMLVNDADMYNTDTVY